MSNRTVKRHKHLRPEAAEMQRVYGKRQAPKRGTLNRRIVMIGTDDYQPARLYTLHATKGYRSTRA